jgi:hypothetical protein
MVTKRLMHEKTVQSVSLCLDFCPGPTEFEIGMRAS